MYEAWYGDLSPNVAFGLAGLNIVIFLIVFFLFARSLQKTLARVPKENHLFPSWFVWLMVIPVVTIIFQWMMLPFGIPHALEKTVVGNPAALKKVDRLFKLGLWMVILSTISAMTVWFPGIAIFSLVLGVGAFIVWVLYWRGVVVFRREFLTA